MRGILRVAVRLALVACVGAMPFGLAYGQTKLGRPHNCTAWEGENAGVEGTTTLHFTITKKGTTANPRVIRSSGSTKQDAAALQCVRVWRYKQALGDDAPFATQWTADVAWNMTIPANIPTGLEACAVEFKERARTAVAANTRTEFAFAYDGYSMSGFTISHSSGDADLDKAAADCLAGRTDERERVVIHSLLHLLPQQKSTFPGTILWNADSAKATDANPQ